jgi:hypothetical protein
MRYYMMFESNRNCEMKNTLVVHEIQRTNLPHLREEQPLK